MRESIIIMIAGAFIAVMMIMIGVHNIDNAYNIKIVEADTGYDYKDCSMMGNFCEQEGVVYDIGLGLVFLGMVILVVSFIFLFYTIILDENERKKKKMNFMGCAYGRKAEKI